MPTLFLDIDGVINPYQYDSNLLEGDWKKVSVNNHIVWFSQDISDWLNNLIQNNVTIVWASTWVNHLGDLQSYAKILNLNPLLHCIEYNYLEELWDVSNCGKLPGVKKWIKEKNPSYPIVWIDDEIGPLDVDWANSNNIITCAPQPSLGLSRAVLREKITIALLKEESNGNV